MASFIDLTNPVYSTLSQFGLLASTAITTTGPTTVNGGLWGDVTGTITGTPAITPGTPPSGVGSTGAATTAESELVTLIGAINVVTAALPSTVVLSATPGNYTFLPGINYVNTTANGVTFTTNIVTFDAGGDANAQFFITVDDNAGLTFTDTPFVLANGAKFSNIFFLTSVGAITSTYADNTATDIGGNFIAETAVTFTYPRSITGHVFARTTAITIDSQATAGTTINTENSEYVPVICYAKGTLVLSKTGFVPIENIKAGDAIITKGKIQHDKFVSTSAAIKVEPVIWASKFTVLNLDSKSRPICITKGALGNESPFQDLYISPNHRVIINGTMVSAKNLVNGETIYQDEHCDSVEYYHLECEYHSAIIANGVLAESYLECNNRDIFEASVKLRNMYDFRSNKTLRAY